MTTANGGGFWALKKHGEAGAWTLVWVLSVSDAGVARFVKGNPWWHRVKAGVRDPRAGWTQAMTCKAAELLTVLTSLNRKHIAEMVAAIGEPGGGA